MPRGKRAPGNTQVSISLSEDLLRDIDEAAAEENRKRSNYIVTVLAKKVAERKARIALEAGAPHAQDFRSTARAPRHGTPSLNEDAAKHDAVPPTRANLPAETPPEKYSRIRKGSSVAKENPKP